MTNASRYWQVRCYLKGKTYTQSLKTTNKQAAISAAKQFFHIKTAELYGTGVIKREDKPNKFSDVVPAMFAFQQARVKRGEYSNGSLVILRNRLDKTILPFFGQMSIEQVGYQQLSDFVEKMSLEDFSTTTMQQHSVFSDAVLGYLKPAKVAGFIRLLNAISLCHNQHHGIWH